MDCPNSLREFKDPKGNDLYWRKNGSGREYIVSCLLQSCQLSIRSRTQACIVTARG